MIIVYYTYSIHRQERSALLSAAAARPNAKFTERLCLPSLIAAKQLSYQQKSVVFLIGQTFGSDKNNAIAQCEPLFLEINTSLTGISVFCQYQYINILLVLKNIYILSLIGMHTQYMNDETFFTTGEKLATLISSFIDQLR